jgi:hypothetical protein
MRQHSFPRLAAAILFATALLGGQATFAQDALFHRWVEVEARLTDSPKLYNGSYQDLSVGRLCGETDPTQFINGAMYIVETPLDYSGGQITDFVFNSKALVGGVKETTKFFVSIGPTRTDVGARPAAYVLDTERPAPNNVGEAKLEPIEGGTKITIKGTDSLGQGIQATVICWEKEPKKAIELKERKKD